MKKRLIFGAVLITATALFGEKSYYGNGHVCWYFTYGSYGYDSGPATITRVECNGATELDVPATVDEGGYSPTHKVTNIYPSVFGAGVLSVIFNPDITFGPSMFCYCSDLQNVYVNGSHTTRTSIGGVVYDKAGKVLVFVPNARTSVTIPESVTNILADAFVNCRLLEAINVVTANEYYTSVDGVLYNKAMTELIKCPRGIRSVVIPDTVTNICYRAFYHCELLTEVDIPLALKSVGREAFYGCSQLEEVLLPVGMVNIGNEAFALCGKLSSISIPDGMTDIGSGVFKWCYGLVDVQLPSSMTKIGCEAFAQCTNLTSIIIPEGVTSIGTNAFAATGLSKVVLPSTMTTIEYDAFNCAGIRDVTVPQSLCSSTELKTIFPSSYQLITNVVIGDGTTTIGAEVFSGFSSLSHMTIPDSVTSINTNAFKGCTALNNHLYTQQVKDYFSPESGTSVRYALGDVVQDRTIVSVTVDSDCAIDEFVLADGKVYDCAVRIVNTADAAVQISLPSGYVYESFVGAAPLTLPPHSTNMLTITRTGDRTFLVARRQLQPIGQ